MPLAEIPCVRLRILKTSFHFGRETQRTLLDIKPIMQNPPNYRSQIPTLKQRYYTDYTLQKTSIETQVTAMRPFPQVNMATEMGKQYVTLQRSLPLERTPGPEECKFTPKGRST